MIWLYYQLKARWLLWRLNRKLKPLLEAFNKHTYVVPPPSGTPHSHTRVP